MRSVALLAEDGTSKASKVKAAAATKKDAADLNRLSMEVAALQTLRNFGVTPTQLRDIAAVGARTTAKSREREAAKADAKFASALRRLRDALVTNDHERMESVQEAIDEIREATRPDLDDDVEVTEGARQEVVHVMEMLAPVQLAAYLSNFAEEFPTPVDALLEGLDDSRDLEKDEWRSARDELAQHAAALVVGPRSNKAKQVQSTITQFLDRAHQNKDWKKADLQREARKVVGHVNPMTLLRNRVEIDLCELLSNPELEHAARTCLSVARK